MEVLAAGHTQAFVAVFSVLRLDQIAGRYGAAAVHEVMRHVAASLASELSSADRLFEWDRLAFVAVLRRDEPAPHVQREIRRLIHSRFENELHELNLGRRAVMVAIACAWAMFPLAGPVAALKAQIEQFLASRPAGSTLMHAGGQTIGSRR
jgi:hypothetical protein